ncbi:MAG TPA: ATP-binding protein, partial [Ktedonobacteraceae bacterium]|nr:ATP-binding protein [Ktedonobacteraceae bacterium]
ETGMFSLHRQPADLVTVAQEILAEHREAMGSTLRVEILAPSLEVEMDRERISQVLLNLLSNARKYSSKGSTITVRVHMADEHALISVEDQGVGIPTEKLDHIFERFYRVPEIDVQTGSSSGVGLGLYIAKKIVERHDGRLTASSIPGQGSIFTIHLPLLQKSEQKSSNHLEFPLSGT